MATGSNIAASAKISSKYQIVIPQPVRREMHLSEGQTLFVVSSDRNSVTFSTESAIDRARRYFLGSKVWGDDPVAEIRSDRDEWDGRTDVL